MATMNLVRDCEADKDGVKEPVGDGGEIQFTAAVGDRWWRSALDLWPLGLCLRRWATETAARRVELDSWCCLTPMLGLLILFWFFLFFFFFFWIFFSIDKNQE